VVRIPVLLALLACLVHGVCGADTPGAQPVLDNDEGAATFSWDGYLCIGQPKAITIEVNDETYIHKRTVGGIEELTIVFLVFHDDPAGWGSAIQNASVETFTGPGGYMEKAYLPVVSESGKWVGEAVIVPSESIRAMEVWEQPNSGRVHFGVRVERFAQDSEPSKCTATQQRRAVQLHRNAWADALARAASDDYFKYALYESRSLAVAHPEVYLKGDALFADHITSVEGYGQAYTEEDPHSMQYSGKPSWFSGPPFSFGQVDARQLTTTTCMSLYPDGAPFYPYIDRRVLPISSCLKTTSGFITELEKAFLFYFQRRAEDGVGPFIVYCDTGRAYLSDGDELLSMAGFRAAPVIDGNPVLIFNENAVWYPLMGRDETNSDPGLKTVVARYQTDCDIPELSAFETEIASRLKAITALRGNAQHELAVLAAARAHMMHSKEFRQLWDKHKAWAQYGIHKSTIHIADYLSPFAAYLAGLIEQLDLPGSVSQMIDCWHRDCGLRHGHIWRCGLVEYTIDEAMRIGFFHCEGHAEHISAVLDLAGVENYVIKAATLSSPTKLHTTVTMPDLGYVISNGEITDRGTILNHEGGMSQDPLNVLLAIRQGTRWAMTILNSYCGNWSPGEVATTLKYLQGLFGDEIYGYATGWLGQDPQIVDPVSFLRELQTLGSDWGEVSSL